MNYSGCIKLFCLTEGGRNSIWREKSFARYNTETVRSACIVYKRTDDYTYKLANIGYTVSARFGVPTGARATYNRCLLLRFVQRATQLTYVIYFSWP